MWQTLLGTPKPHIIHQVLEKNQLKEKVIIVGDVHGCFEELKDLLHKCNYSAANSTLIFVGDLVNKGPFSAETIKFARKEGAYCVRGNHDDSMLSHALKLRASSCKLNMFPSASYTLPNRYSYVYDLNNDDINWVKELPYTLSIPTLNAVVVHAGLIPGVKLENQNATDMYMLRNLIYTNGKKIVGTSKAVEGEPWASLWARIDTSPTHVFFGHDAKRGE